VPSPIDPRLTTPPWSCRLIALTLSISYHLRATSGTLGSNSIAESPSALTALRAPRDDTGDQSQAISVPVWVTVLVGPAVTRVMRLGTVSYHLKLGRVIPPITGQ
jgi:hypothetical protein